MNGMMMAASSGEQNAGVSVNASDAVMGGKDSLLVEPGRSFGQHGREERGGGSPTRRFLERSWWSWKCFGKKVEPSLAVLLRPWIYDQFQTFPEERRTLGIKRWWIVDGWRNSTPLSRKRLVHPLLHTLIPVILRCWCACDVAHTTVWRRSDQWRSMDGWKENWMYRHMTQGLKPLVCESCFGL